ncbi:PfkB family carbohydrate kinase [Loigolactobacillus binensis]|uniref:pyridoxal kinase n=1 Tax=Loigolactobacillus binensis TaxID=2559922 RepID=A0ABW3EBM7_9LACO|nr:PfkB family carbohydrate kinase [Loigolactobacillus binensis]
MNANKLVRPLIVAQDLSAIGSLSQQVALPILAAFNLPQAMLPTSLLSTQTEGFTTPVKVELSSWITQTKRHWQQQQLAFNGLLLGYLGTASLVASMQNLLQDLPLSLVVIDPVMADRNLLYPDLSADYPRQLTAVLPWATVITPNLTEAQLLTGIKVRSRPTETEQYQLLTTLEQKLPPAGHAVITGITKQKQSGCIWLTAKRVQFFGRQQLAGHFYGSGDAFAALLTGFLATGESLTNAIHYAVSGTYCALRQTAASHRERRFGLALANLLFMLSEYNQTGNWPPYFQR